MTGPGAGRCGSDHPPDGATSIDDIAVLGDQQRMFGPVVNLPPNRGGRFTRGNVPPTATR